MKLYEKAKTSQWNATIAEMMVSFQRAETGADEHPPPSSVISLEDSAAEQLETPWDDTFEIGSARAGFERRVGFTELADALASITHHGAKPADVTREVLRRRR